MVYRFGAFELDDEAGELRRSGELVAIQPKPLALLVLLVRERARIVSQDELFEALWPGTAVTPSSLTRAVSHARRAIDDTHKGSLIRSVSRRGYRFAGEVLEAADRSAARPAPPGRSARKADGLAGIFVGRDDALARLHAAWSSAMDGSGGIALVSGPAGIGKTRLVEVFAEQVRQMGARTVVGSCRDGEGVPAFWLWAQVLRRLASLGLVEPDPSWDTLLSGSGGGSADGNPVAELSPEQRFLFFDSVTRALSRVAAQQPLVLVLEDIQWARSASLRLLEHIAFEVSAKRLMIVATIRTEVREHGDPLVRSLSILRKHEHSTVLDLGGLSRASVAAMLTGITGRPPPAELTSELFALTEGVPLFLREAVRMLGERGDLRRPERIRRRGITLPTHAIDLIRRPLASLSKAASALVGAGAVLGREFSLAQVATVAQVDRGEALDLLDEAITAGVLEEAPDTPASYRFTHALFQDAAYDGLQASSRARLHLRAAQRLEAQHAADPSLVIAELANHHHQALAIGDPERAFEVAVQAAEHASRVFAYEQAADHYEQAADALEQFESVPPARRLSTLLALGEAHRLSGDRARRRAVCEQAMTSARALAWRTEFAQAAIGFCGLTEWSPHDEAAFAAIDESLADLPDDEVRLRARLLARRAYLTIQSSPKKAEPIAREALAQARRSGDPEAVQECLYTLLYAIAGPDHLEERREMIGELETAARAHRGSETTVIAALDLACDALSVGDPEGATDMRRRASALAGEAPSPGMVWHLRVFDTGKALLEGRFDEVEQRARDALLVGERIDHPFARACHNGHIMQLHRERGEHAAVAALFEPAARGRRTPTRWVKAVLGQTAFRLGDRDRAADLLEELGASGFQKIDRGIRWFGTIVEAAHLCADLEDAARAEELLRLLRPVEHCHGVLPVPIQYGGPVSFCLARLNECLGMADAAAQLYEEALASVEAMGARPMQARIQIAAAALLARSGHREHAGRLEKEGRALAAELGLDLAS